MGVAEPRRRIRCGKLRRWPPTGSGADGAAAGGGAGGAAAGGGPVLEEPPLQPDPMALEVRDGPVVVNPPPCRRGRLGSARWCA
jgi:hypothetical protein